MKKVTIIISLQFLLNHFLVGQDTLRNKKFNLGAFVSPDYSYRMLPNNTGIADTIARLRNSLEIPKFAYTLGLDFLYQIRKRMALSLGFQYSIKGEKTKSQVYIFSSLPRSSTSTPLPTSSYFKYNTTYIDLPLRIDIYLSKKKIAPFISAGISTNIFLFEKIKQFETFVGGEQSERTYAGNKTYYKINPQFQLGGGVVIVINKSRLRVFPIGRISVLRVNSGPVNGYFYSFGLGINYFFGL